MGGMRISLLGGFNVAHDGAALLQPASRRTQALLAYLLLKRQRSHQRDVLAEVFWGDAPDAQARRCLRTALWRLRKILEPRNVPSGTYLVTSSAGEVAFNRESDYWLDVASFEDGLDNLHAEPERELATRELQELQRTLDLYRGDLLEGIYDDWILADRERLRCLHLTGLHCAMHQYQRRDDYEAGLAMGRRILAEDPLRESVHRDMMRMYCLNSQRGEAIGQYQHCAQVLMEELGIAPMEETRRLFETLLSGATAMPPSPVKGEAVQSLRLAKKNLHRAAKEVERAQNQVLQAIHDVVRAENRKG